MLSVIKNFFKQSIAPEVDEEGGREHRLRLVTAALLVEMMSQDQKVTAEEIAAVKVALMEKYTLTDAECQILFNLAEEEARQAVDYHQFTRLIAQEFSYHQKIEVIELLWSVAYADLELAALEEHMVRKVANLIHISHKDFIRAKHRVEATLQRKQSTVPNVNE